ncbi:hypothetical protein M569_05040 [Genlisea aurea]|uniref:NB-ARC domain-containing protein n=1 Tax=Genlisea aurea TaxID=192259 RepID=S8CSE1_9LAMI|nr:hypothetical protein M569_05040 [Genlisea aurea]
MNTLGMLSKLEILKLKESAFIGEKWQIDGSGFHSLEYLYIERSDLTLWTVSENSFEKLRYLVIKNCEKLLNIPDGLVRKLKTLEVERVSRDAMSSLNQLEKKKKENPKEFHEYFKLIITPV